MRGIHNVVYVEWVTMDIWSLLLITTAQCTLRELKSNISAQSKQNFVLERDVRFLDSRIALLINRALDVCILYYYLYATGFWHLYIYIYIAKWSSFPSRWCRWRREWPLSRRKAHATIWQLVLFIAKRTSSHCKSMSSRQSCRNWHLASNRHVHAVW